MKHLKLHLYKALSVTNEKWPTKRLCRAHMLPKRSPLIKITTAPACLAFAMGQVTCWSCHTHLLIELSHAAMPPPFITKKMKLKEVKLLYQGHASDSADLIKSSCGILSCEATVGKATVFCSCRHYWCISRGLYQVLRPACDTVFLMGICDMQAFSKPRSPVSTDYNVILDSENPNNLMWSEATDKTTPQHN